MFCLILSISPKFRDMVNPIGIEEIFYKDEKLTDKGTREKGNIHKINL